MKGQRYLDELAAVVALPCLMNCSLIDFARRIRVQIESELAKINPDNSLIALLADAARLGWEQIEQADNYGGPKDAKEVAIAILKNTVAPGNGGYTANFGPTTYKKLIEIITGGDERYCEKTGHLKHNDFNFCICCHEEIVPPIN